MTKFLLWLKKFLLWSFALIITLAAVQFQRRTGPTKPVFEQFTYNGKNYSTSLQRSAETTLSHKESKGDYKNLGKKANVLVHIDGLPDDVEGRFIYNLYPGNWPSDTIQSFRNGSAFLNFLPAQPAAGKIKYKFILYSSSDTLSINKTEINLGGEGVVLRFKGHVPLAVLIPHIILMFIAMLLSNYIGITSFFKEININRKAVILLVILGLGGLVFGPVVQKFAFGEFWTGWPFGEDLTDNKTLFAFIIWALAWFFNRKKVRRYLYLIAAIVMLLVYSIPHSTAGSEYDHSKGQVVTGK